MKKNISHSNPYELFEEWFTEAQEKELNDPSAMALAAVNEQGRPTVRMVLMRGYDNRGFKFFTNYNSNKAKALSANPYAETNFYWKSLKKQIRISGAVEKVSKDESDEYYNSRLRDSRIGAWASKQSQIMEHGYEDLENLFAEYDERFDATKNPPRPDHWGGFRIVPEKIEFWEEQPYRLHKRFIFTRADNGDWKKDWLYP